MQSVDLFKYGRIMHVSAILPRSMAATTGLRILA